MTDVVRPAVRPARPFFSSGPCAKRPGWTLASLNHAPLGRSHRAVIGKARLADVIDLSREILGIPADYRIGIMPASDTGAIEAALWSLLGPRPVAMALLAGGSYDKRYYHVQVPGRSGYSAAEHLASHGDIVLLLDHLGVGESTRVPRQKQATRFLVAQAMDAAVASSTSGSPPAG